MYEFVTNAPCDLDLEGTVEVEVVRVVEGPRLMESDTHRRVRIPEEILKDQMVAYNSEFIFIKTQHEYVDAGWEIPIAEVD